MSHVQTETSSVHPATNSPRRSRQPLRERWREARRQQAVDNRQTAQTLLARSIAGRWCNQLAELCLANHVPGDSSTVVRFRTEIDAYVSLVHGQPDGTSDALAQAHAERIELRLLDPYRVRRAYESEVAAAATPVA